MNHEHTTLRQGHARENVMDRQEKTLLQRRESRQAHAQSLIGSQVGQLVIGEGLGDLFAVTDRTTGLTEFRSAEEVASTFERAVLNGIPVRKP